MSAPSPRDAAGDRGLRAVRRVRSVRERDARVGLRVALEEEQRLREAADRVAAIVDAAAAPASPGASPGDEAVTDGAALLAQRGRLLLLGAEVAAARERADAAGRLAHTARDHWRHAHERVEAADHLLDTRATARRAEAARGAARELDELGLRRRAPLATPRRTESP